MYRGASNIDVCESEWRTEIVASAEENRVRFIWVESQTVMTEPGPKVIKTIFSRE